MRLITLIMFYFVINQILCFLSVEGTQILAEEREMNLCNF